MDISYFQKINNTYQSSSRQETDLYLLNRRVDDCFADTIGYHIVKRNGEPFELLIIKDTDGNTFKKKIKSKHSTPFNLGDYIEWNGQMWLVTLLDSDDKTYHSGYMYLCTIQLWWQNSKGDVISRWAYSEDFTKYSAGIKENKVMITGDNQRGITLPVDDETKVVKRGRRFAIDIEGVEPPDIYKVTNRKTLLADDRYFGRGGILNLTLSYTEFNTQEDHDRKVALPDGTEVWICDYFTPDNHEPVDKNDILLRISGTPKLQSGVKRKYTVTCSDEKGNEVATPADFAWNVICAFDDVLETTINGDTITLFINDDDYIDEKFKLQVLIGGVVKDELVITVAEIWG